MSDQGGYNQPGGYNPQGGGYPGGQGGYNKPPYGPPQGYGGQYPGGGPGGSGSGGFDMQKIMPGGMVALVGGIVYFVASFFPWIDACGGLDDSPYSSSGLCSALSFNAWAFGLATFSVILFLLVAVTFIVKALGVIPPNVPIELIALGLAVLADILFLIEFINFVKAPGFGLWIALAGAIATTVGAVLEFIKAGAFNSIQRGGGGGSGPQSGYGPPPQSGYGPPPQSGGYGGPPQGGGYPPRGGQQPPPPPRGPGGGYPPPQQGGGYPPPQNKPW